MELPRDWPDVTDCHYTETGRCDKKCAYLKIVMFKGNRHWVCHEPEMLVSGGPVIMKRESE